jgi:hypothetical protein
MSHKPSHSTEHMAPPPAQAEESIAWFKVIGVGAGALLVFVIATMIAWRFQTAREKELQPLGPDPLPLQIGQGEIGIVDQAPFDITRYYQTYRDDRNARLGSWGWVDRKAGTIHMPIDQAMDRVVKESSK